MTKICDYCDNSLVDGEIVTIIANVRYKQIPSRVAFALSTPDQVEEIYHQECFIYAYDLDEGN
jgi:hypothetical protein